MNYYKRLKSHPLLKSSMGTFGLKVFAASLGIISSILFARLLGPEQFGVYSIVLSLIGLLGTVAALGLPSFMVREVSVCHAKEEWGQLKGLLFFAIRMIVSMSIVVAALVLLMYGLRLVDHVLTLSELLITLILIPLFAFNSLRSSALKGLHWVVRSDFPDLFVQPLLILLVLLLFFSFGASLDGVGAIFILMGGMSLAFFVGLWLLRAKLPEQLQGVYPEEANYHWFRSTKVFFAIAIVGILQGQLPLYFVDYIIGSEGAGLFQVAAVLAGVVAIGLVAVNSPLQPKLARAWGRGDRREAQNLVSSATWLAFLISLPPVLILFFFSKDILALYGAEYLDASLPLRVLLLGQLFNALSGSCMAVLMMTNNQRYVLLGLSFAAVSNVLFSYLLIPEMGILGASIALSLGMLLWNATLAYLAWKKTGIVSIVWFKRRTKD